MALAGNAITLFLVALIGSVIVYNKLNRSRPFEGGALASVIILGSPFIAGFQIFAIIRTKASDIGGKSRIAVYAVNILGLLIGLFLVAMLAVLWSIGPINPG